MKQIERLSGLIAAPHTPMNPDGSLNVSQVVRQAEYLANDGVRGVFICGSTGESHSLTQQERMAMAEAWSGPARDSKLKLIVQVGDNCLEDARELARHAAEVGVDALGAMPPSYFRPDSVNGLIDCCASIAEAAPDLPFYYYDIPGMTGVKLSMLEFLENAQEAIPSLAGIKFSNTDLIELQRCVQFQNKKFNILFGSDEQLLAGLVLGVDGAVGSTFNYAAPHYLEIMRAFAAGEMDRARKIQRKMVHMVDIQLSLGVVPSGKAIMGMLGVDCGPVRLPLIQPDRSQLAFLHERLVSAELFGALGKA